jgi:DHA2 family multidrug resistance protein
MLAANDIFWIIGWLFLVLIFVIWATRPPFRGATGAPPPVPTVQAGIVRG